jgi:hypothetical protein
MPSAPTRRQASIVRAVGKLAAAPPPADATPAHCTPEA